MPETSTAVLVLGMHRTGTSLTMAALEALGVDTGNHLLPPGPDNQTGYWEDETVLRLNERLLAVLGKTWHSVSSVASPDWAREGIDELRREAAVLLRNHFSGSKLWGFKDPRCIRMLPFWRQVLSDIDASVRYVVTFRNPEAVAASLAHRNGFPRTKSYFIWLAHYLPYLDSLLGDDCQFVDYDRLMDHPMEVVNELNCVVNETNDLGHCRDRVRAFLSSTLRSHLRHARFEFDDIGSSAPTLLRDTLALLNDLAASGSHGVAAHRVRNLQERFHEYDLLLRQMDGCEAEAGRLQAIVSGEESVRDKIHKMGLYQADIQQKMERIDSRQESQAGLNEGLARNIASVAKRVENIEEKVVMQIDRLIATAAKMDTLEQRVEDVQEKVVVQIDEVHRMLTKTIEHTSRVQQLADELNAARADAEARVDVVRADAEARVDVVRADAKARIDAVYHSTSWRITRPLRALMMAWRRIRRR